MSQLTRQVHLTKLISKVQSVQFQFIVFHNQAKSGLMNNLALKGLMITTTKVDMA